MNIEFVFQRPGSPNIFIPGWLLECPAQGHPGPADELLMLGTHWLLTGTSSSPVLGHIIDSKAGCSTSSRQSGLSGVYIGFDLG